MSKKFSLADFNRWSELQESGSGNNNTIFVVVESVKANDDMASTQNSQEVLSERRDPDEVEGETEEKRPNAFLRFIQYHYGVTKYEKSPEQISREKNLLPGVPFNRWFLMPAAVIIQFCCGSLYAWSVFNKPIDILIYGTDYYGKAQTNLAPVTFYIAVGCFGISAALMGPWLERRGPMIACILGTSLFVAGNYISALALALHQLWLVYIGYGIVSGFGLGLCYISPVSALQKWFPDKRGLASGMAVCGFGAGSIAIAKVQLPLIKSVGLPWTFVILGSIYLILMILSGLVLRTPPPNYTVNGMGSEQKDVEKNHNDLDSTETSTTETKTEADQEPSTKPSDVANEKTKTEETQISLIDALTSKDFRFMYVMLLSNSIFGLVGISKLSDMVQDIFEKSPEDGSTVVSINGAFNLGGRIFFSVLSDYIGRKNCFFIMLTSQLVILGTFSTITTTKTYWAFRLTMWFLTACYGAGFGVVPAFLSDQFGPTNIGACHGVILTAWSLAGVGGGLIFTVIFNTLRDSGDISKSDPFPYNVNAWWIFVIVLIGWFSLFFVSPTKRDKSFTKRPRRFFSRAVNRITNKERSFEMN